jgi:formyl-CoA transferase
MTILQGIRVVEIGQVIAAPYAGCIFADLGAEVIKIERIEGGDDARMMGAPFRNGDSMLFTQWNRSKKSLALNLRDASDRARLGEILTTTDILVHNLRPDIPETVGLGNAELRKRHPQLIVCEISGFGAHGPLKLHPATEPLIQAFRGLSALNGGAEDPPMRMGASICDQGSGMWSVIGALALLQRRHLTGEGGIVSASLLETALVWGSQKLDDWINREKLPERHRSGHPNMMPYEAFDASDGPLVICAGNDRLFEKFAKVLKRTDWIPDARYRTNRDRLQNRNALFAEIQAILKTDDRATWIKRLEDAGVPCAAINTIPETAREPQVAALGIIQDVPGTDYVLTGMPISFDGVRPSIRFAAPTVGADNAEFGAAPPRKAAN